MIKRPHRLGILLPTAFLLLGSTVWHSATAQSGATAQPGANDASASANFIGRRKMNNVSQQAERRIADGYNLAKRGALYAARTEFIGALRLIAQALDAEHTTRSHSQSLALGMRCLEESDDFVPSGTQMESDLNIAMLANSHRTPVFKNEAKDDTTALTARQRYYTFAQEQLGSAVADQPSGSAALSALGKLSVAMSRQRNSRFVAGIPKAMVFQQAALIADGGNAEAANELGVLLAQFGLYEAARDVLLESVSRSPEVASWHNLSVVQHHLGNHRLASLADLEARRAQASANERSQAAGLRAVGKYQVRWVQPSAFAGAPGPSVPAMQSPSRGLGAESHRRSAARGFNRRGSKFDRLLRQ